MMDNAIQNRWFNEQIQYLSYELDQLASDLREFETAVEFELLMLRFFRIRNALVELI